MEEKRATTAAGYEILAGMLCWHGKARHVALSLWSARQRVNALFCMVGCPNFHFQIHSMAFELFIELPCIVRTANSISSAWNSSRVVQQTQLQTSKNGTVCS